MTTPISPDPRSPFFSRREMLKTLSSGFGYLAFAGLGLSLAQSCARALGLVLIPNLDSRGMLSVSLRGEK